MAVVAAVVSDGNSSGGNYSLGVAPNTELRIRVKAHMQQTGAGGPRWNVKVTDNTSRNALLYMRVAFSEGFKRAFVKVSFAQSGAHTLTLTTAAGSRAANPRFRWSPYRGVAQRRSTSQWASTPRSATITGNFRAGEPLVLEAFDEQNTDSVTDNDGDSCFTFSVVKN